MASLREKLRIAAKKMSEQLNRTPMKLSEDADMNSFSIFEKVSVADRSEFMQLAKEDLQCARAIGSMVGMAVCDSVGHAFEFLPVGEEGSKFVSETLEVSGDWNEVNGLPRPAGCWGKFKLKKGQWTDDTSMGLCNADSLLVCKSYDGCDIRMRFWNWWTCGYNNAFRLDPSRGKSVGLGGNIALSLQDTEASSEVTPRFEAQGQDAGNGSLMRLAPIPLYFHSDLDLAVAASRESSFTTHPGPIAADACAFLGYVVVRALKRNSDDSQNAAYFLDHCVKEYLEQRQATMQPELVRLLRSQEKSASTEVCWNWREVDYAKLLQRCVLLRGHKYNGYPVSSGYFGSYSIDGLAMALNAFYHTTSFMDALSRIVNFRGDSDSTGAICGQIAGAFYGLHSIDSRLICQLQTWDQEEIALRAALLYALGDDLPEEVRTISKIRVESLSVAQQRKRSSKKSRQPSKRVVKRNLKRRRSSPKVAKRPAAKR